MSENAHGPDVAAGSRGPGRASRRKRTVLIIVAVAALLGIGGGITFAIASSNSAAAQAEAVDIFTDTSVSTDAAFGDLASQVDSGRDRAGDTDAESVDSDAASTLNAAISAGQDFIAEHAERPRVADTTDLTAAEVDELAAELSALAHDAEQHSANIEAALAAVNESIEQRALAAALDDFDAAAKTAKADLAKAKDVLKSSKGNVTKGKVRTPLSDEIAAAQEVLDADVDRADLTAVTAATAAHEKASSSVVKAHKRVSKDVKAHQKALDQQAEEAAAAEAGREREAAAQPAPSTGGSDAAGTPAKPSTPKPSIPKPAAKPKPKPQATPGASAITGQMLSQINTTRQNAGLNTLSVSSCAEGAARTWASEQARRDEMSHQPLGPVLSSCGARGIAENVAAGYSNGGVFNGWMNSAGHKANILRSSATSVGVAVANSPNGTSYHVMVLLD